MLCAEFLLPFRNRRRRGFRSVGIRDWQWVCAVPGSDLCRIHCRTAFYQQLFVPFSVNFLCRLCTFCNFFHFFPTRTGHTHFIFTNNNIYRRKMSETNEELVDGRLSIFNKFLIIRPMTTCDKTWMCMSKKDIFHIFFLFFCCACETYFMNCQTVHFIFNCSLQKWMVSDRRIQLILKCELFKDDAKYSSILRIRCSMPSCVSTRNKCRQNIGWYVIHVIKCDYMLKCVGVEFDSFSSFPSKCFEYNIIGT